jgi:hypothetical protein
MATSNAVTIDPATNDLTLGPADVLDETIKVTIPKGNRFRTMRLVPSASIAPFVGAVTPAAGYGPWPGKEEHAFTFRVQFHGIPCTAEPQVAVGTLDLIVDNQVWAHKDVRITVPACAPTGQVFAVKFLCGEQGGDCDCGCAPLRPGRYATEINLHNYGLKPVTVTKRFVPLVLAGAPVGREPRTTTPRAEDRIVLPPQSATFDDCCRIVELLYGGAAAAPLPPTVGWLEISADGPLAVTAVYTAGGTDGAGVSIDVVQVAPRRA